MVIERSISVAFGHDRVRYGKSRALGRKLTTGIRGGCFRGRSWLVDLGRLLVVEIISKAEQSSSFWQVA